jgi:Ca2+-binding EF-hand superfamily protein
MNVKTLILLGCSALVLAACASKPAPDRHMRPLSPERAEFLYKKYLKHWDLDGNNQVTCNDLRLMRTQLFAKLDENHNGTLDEPEYRFAKFEDKNYLFFEIKQLDTDLSASLDLGEFLTVSHSEFRHYDQNSDCTVSKAEATRVMSETSRGRGRNREDPDSTGRRGGRSGGHGSH